MISKATTCGRRRVEYVSRFLSPDEVLEYRLRYDGDTTAIAHLFRGLNLSREEFKQVFQVLDAQELRIVNGSFATEPEEKLAASLSPARYEQYKQAMDPANYVLERFIADNRIDSETAQKLRNVRNASGTMSPQELQAATAAALGPQLMPQLGHRFISLPKPQRVGKP